MAKSGVGLAELLRKASAGAHIALQLGQVQKAQILGFSFPGPGSLWGLSQG